MYKKNYKKNSITRLPTNNGQFAKMNNNYSDAYSEKRLWTRNEIF